MKSNEHLGAIETEKAVARHITPAMDRHLAKCTACRDRVARAKAFERTLYAIPRIEPQSDLVAQIRAALLEAASNQDQNPIDWGEAPSADQVQVLRTGG